MNITPHATNVPLATAVNPPTETLRRDNHQREVITQVAATNPAAAEKSVASEKERARTPSQNNEQVDFANLRKQAENNASIISEQDGSHDSEQHAKDHQHEGEEHESPEIKQEEQRAEREEVAEQKVIAELVDRDKEVRAHELAHATTGGSTTGSPTYTFQVGPDGRKYAVGGEVSVDLSPVTGDPRATIIKMQKVHAAALAPTTPSQQDKQVAASATQKILEAQSELLAQANERTDNKPTSIDADKKSLSEDQTVESSAESEFDTLINKTLSAQDGIVASMSGQEQATLKTQTIEVQQRSQRIAGFYSDISQGYEKPDKYQFELTA